MNNENKKYTVYLISDDCLRFVDGDNWLQTITINKITDMVSFFQDAEACGLKLAQCSALCPPIADSYSVLHSYFYLLSAKRLFDNEIIFNFDNHIITVEKNVLTVNRLSISNNEEEKALVVLNLTDTFVESVMNESDNLDDDDNELTIENQLNDSNGYQMNLTNSMTASFTKQRSLQKWFPNVF